MRRSLARGGPADLDTAVRLTFPTAYRALPAWAMAAGRAPKPVDARIYNDVVWVLRRYDLRVMAAREAGHHTHGDGTAVDLVPATGTTQRDWDATAGRARRDLGWTARCGSSGARPACPLKPAIQWIGYDGYPSHGSPRTCSGRLPGAHPRLMGVGLLRLERARRRRARGSWRSPCRQTATPPGSPRRLTRTHAAAPASSGDPSARWWPASGRARAHAVPRPAGDASGCSVRPAG